MKKMKRLAVMLLALLPIGAMAQTTLVTDPESGLEYLDDGDGKLYIDVSSNAIMTLPNGKGNSNVYFVSDGGLRSNWRQNLNNSQGKWYKEDLDAIESVSVGNNQPTTYKGVEYFRNLKSLTVPAGGNNQIAKISSFDLSKNTKLETLSFNKPAMVRITNFDISNTQLTDISIPTATTSYLTTFKAANTQLTTVNLSSFRNIETIDVRNSAKLESLTLPTATNGLKKLYIEGSGISSLNLSNYTNLAEVTFDNTQLTLGTDLIVPNYLDGKMITGNVTRLVKSSSITDLTIDLSNETNKDFDISSFSNLRNLTLIGVESITLPSNLTTLTMDVTQSPNIGSLDLSSMTDMSSLTLIGSTGLTPPTSLTTLTIDVTEWVNKNVDFSTCTNLRNLYIANATGLTLAPGRTSFYLYAYGDTELDVDFRNQTNLYELYCYGVHSVNVSEMTSLQTLQINNTSTVYNTTEVVDCSGCTSLTTLNCYQTKKLKASGCIALDGGLNIYVSSYNSENNKYCKFEEIDLSGCTNLKTMSITDGVHNNGYQYEANLKK